MDVDIDRRVHDLESSDAGLFLGLAQCHVCEIRITVGMSTGLQPPLKFGVKQDQTCLTARVDDERGTGQVARPAGANRDVFVGIDELKDAVAVFIETVASGVS
jgi:hypothetical protein